MVSKYEVKAQKELEKEGWIVDNKRGMGRWAKNRDFFNLFDLVAVHPKYHDLKMRWISIKGHKGGSTKAHRADILAFPLHDETNKKELWYWAKDKKRGHWVKIEIS